jgi:hypothetical protein
VAGGVCCVGALREIDQDEPVAEGVADHGETAHGDVAWLGEDSAAVASEGRDSVVDGLDEPVGLVGVLGGQDELGVGVR